MRETNVEVLEDSGGGFGGSVGGMGQKTLAQPVHRRISVSFGRSSAVFVLFESAVGVPVDSLGYFEVWGVGEAV